MPYLSDSIVTTRRRSFGMMCNGQDHIFTFYHNLNTRDVAFYFYDSDDNPVVWSGGFTVQKHLNALVFDFGFCPEAGKSYKLMVIG